MKTAVRFAASKNQANNSDVPFYDLVPHVEVYRTQLYILLYASLSHHNYIIDFDLFNPSSTNLIVTNHTTKESVVLVCLAHGPDLAAFEQTRRESIHKHREGVKEVWILNFSTTQPSRATLWPPSENEERPLHVIHVYHDLSWTKGKKLQDGVTETLKLQK